MNFRDFILKNQNSEEIRSILNNLREIVLEIKPGKKYLLKLTNKLTPSKFWFSSTNNPDGRESHLRNLIKNHSDRWYEPMWYAFRDLLDKENILDNIKFERKDPNAVSIEDALRQPVSSTDLENIKKKFKELLLKYLKQVNQISKGLAVGGIIDKHFNSNEKLAPLEVVINSIDYYLDNNTAKLIV